MIIEKLLDSTKKIRVRVLGLVALSVFIPSLASGWLALKYLDETIKAQVLRDVSTHTERTGTLISDWLTKRSLDIRAFTSSYLLKEEVETLLQKGNSRQIRRSRNAVDKYLSYLLEDNPIFTSFFVTSTNGRTLASRPDGVSLNTKEVNFKDFSGTEPVMLEIEGDNYRSILIAQPVGDGSPEKSALFIATIDTRNLLKYVGIEPPPYSSAYLVDVGGRIKGTPVPLSAGTVAPKEVKALFRNPGLPREYKGMAGEQVIGTSTLISHLPWFVVIETSRDKAFVPLNRFRRQVFFLALLISVVLLIPALFLAKNIVLPLEELSKTARRIREGEPGLEVSFHASGELGELVESFNTMSRSLRQSMEELSAANSQLMVLTITDPLTGRHNRRYIVDRIESELKLVKRSNSSLSVIMLDLDKFKSYNDRYGHIAGDGALRSMGDLLKEKTRESDVVARYGGEEFLIMLPQTDKEGAERAAEKLRKAVEEAVFKPKGDETRITVSLGVATAPADGARFDELVEAADIAMYAAKDAGRNRVYTFSEQLSRESSPRSPGESSQKTSGPSAQSPQQPSRKKGRSSSKKTSKGQPSKEPTSPKQ